MTERWDALTEPEHDSWFAAVAHWLGGAGRPALGWGALLTVAALTTMPSVVVFASGWLPGGRFEVSLVILGPLMTVLLWLLLGWRRSFGRHDRTLRVAIISIPYLIIGTLTVTLILNPWLPSSSTLQDAWLLRDPMLVASEVAGNWGRLAGRFALWGAGVAAASAPRDNLVLAMFVGAIVWLLAGVTVVLARTTQRGLLAALPILWIVGLLLLYSPADRWVFLLALGLALLLHLLLNQQRLVASWQRRQLDYSPSLFIEHNGLALGGFVLLLAMAALMPNLYVYELTSRYYDLIEPMNSGVEAGIERLFPGLTTGGSPWGRVGRAGGLPNQFLLGAGPDAMERVVMRVRTDEPVYSFDSAPRAHNLRGVTYADYDGRGWDNPSTVSNEQHEPETAWTDLLPGADRRILLQSINLEGVSSILFAAGEPLAPAVGYVATARTAGDLVALSSPARSYTVQSAIPALDETALLALPWWNATNPLPPAYAAHLALPASVTTRTRALAAELVAGAASPYAAATAIEDYLRTFPYDLSVTAPPPEVADVADYFLFDLQRGYCDYYATAFVVLARVAGLPARFATGFAAGSWSAPDRQWVITEAEAHSWPEVYFPEVGWVAFEPTAAQPAPQRVGLPAAVSDATTASEFEPLAPEADATPTVAWVFMLVVLAAVGTLLLVQRVRRRDDPWQALLAWGGRRRRRLTKAKRRWNMARGWPRRCRGVWPGATRNWRASSGVSCRS